MVRRSLPAPMRALVRKGLVLSESASDNIATALYDRGKSIPTPPPKFRALVNGIPIDAARHARIGREMFDLLRERCDLKPSSVVLDIGCGCGRVATPIAEYLRDGIYHGIDIVEPMVDWCKENISASTPHFHFHHADLRNTLYRKEGQTADSYVFPFPDGTFDVIFATSVFTHLIPASANQYAREVARLLKPETGRGLLTFFLTNDAFRHRRNTSKINFPYQCDGYSVRDRSNPEAVVAYEEADAAAMLRNASLSIEGLSLGQWSLNSGWTFQDVFLVSRQ
jgi:SAM-dependent methyltransferase